MKIYCEADSCRWCVDGECGLKTIHLRWGVDVAECEEYEEPEDE